MIKDILKKNESAIAGMRELNALKEFFPQCFSSDGEFDIEKFKAALPEGTNITDETTGFNFLGKSYARMLANMDTTTLIRPDKEHNEKPENRNSKNIYISGDNLDALQHLVKSYYGQVKVIYIDPPYNTGSDGFVYNDKFNFSAESIAALMDKYNGEAFSPKNIVIFGYSFGFTHREELQKNLRALKDGNKSLTVNLVIRY